MLSFSRTETLRPVPIRPVPIPVPIHWFQFEGEEVLDFRGDDDAWVFVDGQLCLDIGGIHGPISATMDLGDPASEVNETQRAIVQACADGLEVGRVYEVALFRAERRVTTSNFRLTLSGFVTQQSECAWVCGDGIVTAFEVCDGGFEENTGEFGKCATDCLGTGPLCGDGVVDPEFEECDLGALNVGSYGGAVPTARRAPSAAMECGTLATRSATTAR